MSVVGEVCNKKIKEDNENAYLVTGKQPPFLLACRCEM